MRIKWFLIFIAYAGLFAYGLCDNARGPIFPDMLSTFHLSDAAGSVFFFLTSFTATVANATAFFWLKRWPLMKTFFAFAVIQTSGLLTIALSPSYPVTLVGAALLGSSMGVLGLIVNVLASNATATELRRQAMAGLHGMYGISSLLAPLLVTLIYSWGGSWRWATGLIGALPILVGIAALARRTENIPDRLPAEPVRAADVSLKQAWPYVFMIGMYVVAEVLLGTRLVLHARRDLDYSFDQANLLLSGYFLALFAGRMLFAVYAFRTATHRLLIVSAGAGLACYVAGLWLHPAAFVGCGFAFSFFYPCAMAEIGARLSSDRASVVMSWVQTFQSLALMVMHFSVGLLSDRFGLPRALWVGLAALIAVLFCLARQVSLGNEGEKPAG